MRLRVTCLLRNMVVGQPELSGSEKKCKRKCRSEGVNVRGQGRLSDPGQGRTRASKNQDEVQNANCKCLSVSLLSESECVRSGRAVGGDQD